MGIRSFGIRLSGIISSPGKLTGMDTRQSKKITCAQYIAILLHFYF